MEQALRDVARIIESNDFANAEATNAFLATLNGANLQQALAQTRPLAAKEEAQDLACEAMEAPTEARARTLVKRALAKDPDCVDALVLLAGLDSRTPKQAIEGLQKAVSAGERSLGTLFFKENKGDFWGLLETRPYMRARQQLAVMLNAAGLGQDAISHYEAMLELNPNDNQGIRESLLGLYLSTNDVDGAAKLLRRYKRDISATFAWGRVLERVLAGDLDGAAVSLKAARKGNRFIELYMSALRPLPKETPEYYELGSEEEAILSLECLAPAWTAHPEAMFWLFNQILGEQPEKRLAPRGKREKKSLIQ
jgi:tetratricopeptide (TPR) repeat protein